jgi:hypothetical protein
MSGHCPIEAFETRSVSLASPFSLWLVFLLFISFEKIFFIYLDDYLIFSLGFKVPMDHCTFSSSFLLRRLDSTHPCHLE